jgi:AcrR family transcriptional regulator
MSETTKDRIMDTAERLFAEHGFGATSLRQIIGEARVNLAAVHYHFGSKENLLEAVFVRRIEGVNRERLEMLDRFEAAGEPTLEQVLEALVAPTLAVARDPERRIFVKIMARMHVEEELLRLLVKHLQNVIPRFRGAVRRALPDLPEVELIWRLHFAVGVLAHTMVGIDKLQVLTGGQYKPGPNEPSVESVVNFMAAGMRGCDCGGRHAR